VRSEQLRAFLRYVARWKLRVEANRLQSTGIAVEALGALKITRLPKIRLSETGPTPCEQNWKSCTPKSCRTRRSVSIFFKGSYRPHFVVQKSPDENGSVAPVIPSAEMAKPQTVEPKFAGYLVWSSPAWRWDFWRASGYAGP